MVINYLIVGVLMLCTMLSLGELAVMYPINGAYYEYTARFCDPSWGFAIGWLYAISWMLTLWVNSRQRRRRRCLDLPLLTCVCTGPSKSLPQV